MEFLQNIVAVQLANALFEAFFGSLICFGPLKWRKGLITSVATYWGLVLGSLIGMLIGTNMDAIEPFFICVFIGVIVFPILTYKVPFVNRFVVGFLVTMKFTFMITTIMMKAGDISIASAIAIPLICGTIVGVILMAWTQIRVSAFVIACAFLGAAQTAPSIAKIFNIIEGGMTGQFFWDPYDVLFAFLKVELTDTWTFIILLILMAGGIVTHLKSIQAQGYSFNVPLIVYETDDPKKHGKIYK